MLQMFILIGVENDIALFLYLLLLNIQKLENNIDSEVLINRKLGKISSKNQGSLDFMIGKYSINC